MLTLGFDGGSLTLGGLARAAAEVPACLEWDARVARHRAPALAYAEVVRWLVRTGQPWTDECRRYGELTQPLATHREARPYQQESLERWRAASGRGVVVLPTGSGKTHVALMAIEDRRRDTLVVAPTLDLVRQWYDLLRVAYQGPVGIVGGGSREVCPLTVTTYDSAYLHLGRLGNRFGLVVFDECHHLPSESYALAAESCIAPYRLGLTATPERTDGREAALERLIGPTVFSRAITELSGGYLSDYDTVTVEVELDDEERLAYSEAREVYLAFIRRHQLRLGGPRGWEQFIARASRSEEGRQAMAAYRRQRELALAARSKLDCVERLLRLHRGERVIVFTEDNATAYAIASRFLLPIITHRTKVLERSEILADFSAGRLQAVVTSKVLNEGVDVPEASVALVVSGSGSVREHVQRLGRILRPAADKRATLYELVTSDTSEMAISRRRREHAAYQERRPAEAG